MDQGKTNKILLGLLIGWVGIPAIIAGIIFLFINLSWLFFQNFEGIFIVVTGSLILYVLAIIGCWIAETLLEDYHTERDGMS